MRVEKKYELTDISLHKELFLENKNKNRLVYLSEDYLDFDF